MILQNQRVDAIAREDSQKFIAVRRQAEAQCDCRQVKRFGRRAQGRSGHSRKGRRDEEAGSQEAGCQAQDRGKEVAAITYLCWRSPPFAGLLL